MNLKKYYQVLISISVLIISNSAYAASNAEVLARQLARAEIAVEKLGYSQGSHKRKVASLRQGESNDFAINLQRNRSYTIIGVCDKDCSDIDLKLYDDNGNLVARDTDYDDLAVIRINPRWGAQFTLRALMPSCSRNPCFYGISVMSKPR